MQEKEQARAAIRLSKWQKKINPEPKCREDRNLLVPQAAYWKHIPACGCLFVALWAVKVVAGGSASSGGPIGIATAVVSRARVSVFVGVCGTA